MGVYQSLLEESSSDTQAMYVVSLIHRCMKTTPEDVVSKVKK